MIVLILFAEDVIGLWLGKEFQAQSTVVFQVLLVGVLAVSLSSLSDMLTKGLGRPDITAKLHLLELLPYIGMVWIFVAEFGIAGAAIAWTIRAVLDSILMFRASFKLLPTALSTFVEIGVLRAIFILLILSAIILLMGMFSNGLLLIFFVIGLVVIFIIASWYYVFDTIDRRSLKVVLGLNAKSEMKLHPQVKM